MIIYKKDTKEIVVIINEETLQVIVNNNYAEYREKPGEQCVERIENNIYFTQPKEKTNIIDIEEYKRNHI